MLRPAVAATNCAKPGNASGLDILEASPIVLKTRFWPSLSGKVPPPGRAVNDGRRPALSRGIAGPACPDENFCPGLLQIPDKTSPFLRISRVSAERYDDHAGPRVSIMPRTLDTQDSGLEELVGPNGYLTSRRTRRRRRQLFRLDLRGRDAVDANDDPAPGVC